MVVTLFADRADVYSVISHLSTGDHAVDEETFQSTMRYIFSFVEKVWSIDLNLDLLLRQLAFIRKSKQRTL